ncbi:MAG: FAD-binding protein [Candidatus Vecturithrix sp.]|jgi:succinate dehydrogenase/fumarate reductase flavoprotein subunit|nr:FAD-binding protein [Candidatus Vecturithrix sp.]
MQHDKKKKLSRRGFIKGTAAGAGVLALTGLTAENSGAVPAVNLPQKWDQEADVVILGTGYAGQATAIEADRAGASVLMLEKASEKYQGGNSRVSGQGFIAPPPHIWEAYFTYLKALTAGLGFPVFEDEKNSDEMLRLYIEESSKSLQWFADMGIETVPEVRVGGYSIFPFFPHMPGAEKIATEPGYYTVGGKYDKQPGRNWYALEDVIKTKPGIKKMYEMPAKRLVQNPATKEILGVVAEKNGKELFVKAKRAVCVCAGGFEYDQQMQRDFQGIQVNYSPGSPYNTGETIKMCWAIGADIRNMGVRNAPVYPTDYSIGIKPPWKSAISVTQKVSRGGMIMIGANNKRFRDEYLSWTTWAGIKNRERSGQEGVVIFNGHVIENGVYVREKTPMPMFIILDEEARMSGPLFTGCYVTQIEGYKCSKGNSAELSEGWLIKADSIEELAKKIGREADPLFGRVSLKETVNHWNENCKAGKDPDFDRKRNLKPISDGPVYAIQVFPQCVNTQGGMARNIKAQVLDIYGKPIPRLYSAGENGDIWTYVYQCMSNVGGGCFGFGRIAGKNAATEKPWS